ncbi:pyridoxamine 5'-phosphate oxidase family protein [Roseobacter sp. HKCCA0434]|uniref:pyridoxamine 5'-phosphate oxidase family protein n=1 Tax=Roseobacter sp. HKCCA0434 TaxID=3079297 RepID=UPI0029059480|nr:pyridoxamine 5'-phosphate oxidase family protein [Roseobacter sp. HKCCA0434]
MLDAAWSMLEAGADGPGGRPVLGTIAPDGPRLRTVVLRFADRLSSMIHIYSDARAAKIDELRRDRRASLHVWDPERALQLRLRGEAIVHEDTALARTALDDLPAHARDLYRASPAPGTPIEDPGAVNFDMVHFALIAFEISEIEVLHITRPFHRRALFAAEFDWQGQWLTP